MTIAYIGSLALAQHIDIGRTCGDVDIVASYDDLQKFHKILSPVSIYPFESGKKYYAKAPTGVIYESELAWPGSLSEELLQLIVEDPETVWCTESKIAQPRQCYASLDVCYMLKMSHRYLRNSSHFLKTMRDIQLMEIHDAKIRPEHQDFFLRREKATYNYSHPSLKQSKKDFFKDDGLLYTLDHDTIHLAVMMLDKPAYTMFKEDESEVYTNKEMFYALPEQIQLYSVAEEAMTLAIERSLVPHPGAMTPKEAFDYALMKLSTSISSGWWRQFAWENYDKVQAIYDETYYQRFLAAQARGIVKPFKGE